ncbi:MAG: YraN family protein [Crocinitomicaceae bacterium]|nr:YraN family protein [Crocinitomicaceae bacterium]MDG1734327.1 YraN family protein [Crocinitomicaceae bacterium]
MKNKGKYGEELAAKHLLSKGYKIHFQNYRFGRLEVDLVCEFQNMIVIVEVKALSSIAFKLPYESVSKVKQKKIIQVSNHLLNEKFLNSDCRFDIVSIFLSNKGPKIEHIEDAFVAEIDEGY